MFIELILVIVGILVGYLLIRAIEPPGESVIKYPDPNSIDQTVYVDAAGMCYQYVLQETECSHARVGTRD